MVEPVEKKVVARYILSKVAPLYLDNERLTRWFEHILRDKVTEIVVSGKQDDMIIHVNSVKRVHSIFKVRFEIKADVSGIKITPKITAIG